MYAAFSLSYLLFGTTVPFMNPVAEEVKGNWIRRTRNASFALSMRNKRMIPSRVVRPAKIGRIESNVLIRFIDEMKHTFGYLWA